MMMFVSPIFYPSKALPEIIQWINSINPITLTIVATRNLVLKGMAPEINDTLIGWIISLVWLELCYRMFKLCETNFADEL